ncbi:MAG: hypothetical protein MMC23_004040 [Stictis urceolatum]|nr:hypothetical protein [Stictis urceolata]
MTARPIFAFASLILTAGAIVLSFFVLLAGAVSGSTLSRFYFLQADTGGVSNAPSTSQWTLWNVCGSGNTNCGPVKPAFPFDPARNFNTNQGLPDSFIGTHKFYYLTRFMFAFVLIALFFAVCSLFLGFLALCSRIGSYLSALMVAIAAFFQTLVACLMTAAYVIGRNNFRSNNQTASIGKYNFGFEWASMACLVLATILFCVGGASSKKDSSYSKRNGFLGRKKSTRSRGSFIDNDASSFQRA